MTGFGRGEYSENSKKMIIEIKSVNHRYCDVNVRLPRKLSFLENTVKSYVKKQVSRGKIDIYLTYEDHGEKQENIKYNETLAREYMMYFQKMSETFNIENDMTVTNLSRYPDVMVLEEQQEDEEVLWKILQKALDRAIEKMIETRRIEGAALEKDIKLKLATIGKDLLIVEEQSHLVVEEYKAKLEIRIHDLMEQVPVDEAKLAMEVAIFADKCCIDEEIVRLRSHINHMERTLLEVIPIGRKLDFLTQEMNREANTILSKANSVRISEDGLNIKTEVEKIREQIQNIE